MFEKSFFINGGFIILEFLEEIVKKDNGKKTINELLEEKKLLGNEQYLLNPSLLIGCLYQTFLVYREQVDKDGENAQYINELLENRFNVISNENEYKLSRAIRNSLAHYNIDMEYRENDLILIFKDKEKNSSDFHFVAEITYINMRLLIQDLAQII